MVPYYQTTIDAGEKVEISVQTSLGPTMKPATTVQARWKGDPWMLPLECFGALDEMDMGEWHRGVVRGVLECWEGHPLKNLAGKLEG